MKILHVVPTYYPAVRYGGPIYSVHGLCKALVKRGHEVEVYTTNIDGPGYSNVPLDQEVLLEGVKVRYFKPSLIRRVYYSGDMRRSLRDQMPQFTLVHIHSIYLWPTIAAAQYALKNNIPYVVAPRGMLERALIKRKSAFVKSIWLWFFGRKILRRAAAIHATTKREADEIDTFNFNIKRMEIVSNGLNRELLRTHFNTGKNKKTEVHSVIDKKKPYLLFLGRLSWKKGLDRLLRALASIPKYHLVIAGNDEENYSHKIDQLIEQHDLKSRVSVIGPVYGDDKWELLKQAKLFILPSYSENFGMAVLEAMSAGCPVVVTPEVGLAEVIKSTKSGIVSDGNPKELSEAITKLLSQPDEMDEMSRNGMQTVEKNYTWDKIAENMEVIYESLVKDRKQRKKKITAMIFTLNEEIHIKRCIESLTWCDEIIVVDSFSQDKTEEICKAKGVRFIKHAFEGFGKSRNWALQNTNPRNDWVLIMDADEQVPKGLADEILEAVQRAEDSIGAFRIKRRFFIWGRWLKYSSVYPSWVVRLVHKDRVRFQNRGHAETQEVQGETCELRHDLWDENLKGMDAWFKRQNQYAEKDALYELSDDKPLNISALFSMDPLVRRGELKRIARKLPFRAFSYFLYSYVLRGGFLDGREGFVFCRMRAMYQQMIVVKKYHLKKIRREKE